MNQFVTMKRAAFIALGLLWGGQEGACASLQEAQKQDIKISVIQEHLLTVEKHEDSDAIKQSTLLPRMSQQEEVQRRMKNETNDVNASVTRLKLLHLL